MLGDIVISVEKAVEQAELYNHPLQREIGFLTVHSMLHLLGYDHEAAVLKRYICVRRKKPYLHKSVGSVTTATIWVTNND